MKAYNMSRKGRYTLEAQLERLDKYETGDLLYVLRAIEADPAEYDEQVIKKVYTRLAEKNIICI